MSDVQRDGSSSDRPRRIWTIVVAGGSGRRFGSMKQFEELGGRRVIDHAVTSARSSSDGVVVVVPVDDVDDESVHFRSNVESGSPDIVVVAGGPTRTSSVRHGLGAVGDEAEIVLVHDAARPFASIALFESVIHAVQSGADGAIPGLPMVDTVKMIEVGEVPQVGAVVPRVVSTPDRATLVSVQTPQAFRADVLRRAYETEIDSTDDSALVEAIGGTVIVVPGEADNRKITHVEDLAWARTVLAQAAETTNSGRP